MSGQQIVNGISCPENVRPPPFITGAGRWRGSVKAVSWDQLRLFPNVVLANGRASGAESAEEPMASGGASDRCAEVESGEQASGNPHQAFQVARRLPREISAESATESSESVDVWGGTGFRRELGFPKAEHRGLGKLG
jgi:hypothetical protein